MIWNISIERKILYFSMLWKFVHFTRSWVTSCICFIVETVAAHEYRLTLFPHLSFVDVDWATFSEIIYLAYTKILKVHLDTRNSHHSFIFALSSRFLFICYTFVGKMLELVHASNSRRKLKWLEKIRQGTTEFSWKLNLEGKQNQRR